MTDLPTATDPAVETPAADALSTDATEPAPRPPPWKNPWIVSFVVGAVILTGLRPCMRHVPDPPAVRADLPALTLTLANGEQADARELWSGDVHILHTVPTNAHALDTTLAHMTYMAEMFERAEVSVQLWTLLPPEMSPATQAHWAQLHGAAESAQWHTASVDDAGWRRLREEILPSIRLAVAADEVWSPSPEDALEGWVILDPEGGMRGYYPTTRDSVQEEMLHRARRTQLAYDIR